MWPSPVHYMDETTEFNGCVCVFVCLKLYKALSPKYNATLLSEDTGVGAAQFSSAPSETRKNDATV